MILFRVKGSSDVHMIDDRGNHFVCTDKDWINGTYKCINPTKKSGGEIGDTYPNAEDIVPIEKAKAIK